MDKYENVRVIFADVEIMKKRSKRSKDSTLWYSLLESIVTKIKPSLFLQKQRGRKNPPLEKKKHEIDTKNTGQRNIEKKNDFRGKIEKRLKSVRALGNDFPPPRRSTESRIMERFTREMRLHEILLHDRDATTQTLKRCSR